MVQASASAAKMEEQYQVLKGQYEELHQRSQGGVFNNSEQRVGEKRRAEDPPANELNCPDIWSHFIADVSKTGYGII
jgi:hypothetical protein